MDCAPKPHAFSFSVGLIRLRFSTADCLETSEHSICARVVAPRVNAFAQLLHRAARSVESLFHLARRRFRVPSVVSDARRLLQAGGARRPISNDMRRA